MKSSNAKNHHNATGAKLLTNRQAFIKKESHTRLAAAIDKPGKWPVTDLLKEARVLSARHKHAGGSAELATILQGLVAKAGWSEPDFLTALVKDIAAKGKETGDEKHVIPK